MTEVFLKLLNMSIAAGWIVLAAVLLRAVMRRSPKWVRCLIWAVVALRLVLPFSIQSPLSIIPSAETVVVKPVESAAAERPDNQMAEQPGGQAAERPDNRILEQPNDQQPGLPAADIQQGSQTIQPGGQTIQPGNQLAPEAREITINTGIPAINALFDSSGKIAEKPEISSDTGNADAMSEAPGKLDVISRIWLGGMALMLCYAAYSYIRLRLQVRASVACDSTVYICDDISSPFILGVFRPRIYLPSNLDPGAQAHVLAHERTHISRRDHLWKPLGYALLAIYWFNPLLWLAYVLFCRDIELACDEKAVSSLDEDGRADYSKALVVCSFQRRAVAACPLAFGEVGVRARVRKILSYRKPAVWITACALVLCIALAECTLTDKGNSANSANAAENETEIWDSAPYLLIDGVSYYAPYMPVSRLPFGYAYMGELSSTQAGDTGLSYMQYFMAAGHNDVYTYQEAGVPAGANEADSTKREWAYVRWIPQGQDPIKECIMTMDDVLNLAAKGDALTWDDLAKYKNRDIGSGLYVYSFTIDDRFSLNVSSSEEWGKGKLSDCTIVLEYRNDITDDAVELGSSQLQAFIDKHSVVAIVNTNTFISPAFEKFWEHDGFTFSFPNIESGGYSVVIGDGSRTGLVDALDSGLILITDLSKYGIRSVTYSGYYGSGTLSKGLLPGPLSLDTLKERYPQFFGLDASSGLTIVYDVANGYQLIPGLGSAVTKDQCMQFYRQRNTISPGHLQAIVDSYGIPDSKVAIGLFFNPITTYHPDSENYLDARNKSMESAFGGRYKVGGELVMEDITPLASVPEEELRKKAPEYFGLNTDYGAVVYVVQYSQDDDFLCIPVGAKGLMGVDILNAVRLTPEEAISILRPQVEKSRAKGSNVSIGLVYFNDPTSDYVPADFDETRLKIWERFGGEFYVQDKIAEWSAHMQDSANLGKPLEERYPQFAGLDTSEGLIAYISLYGADARYGLLPGNATTIDWDLFKDTGTLSAYNFVQILESYKLPPEKVRVMTFYEQQSCFLPACKNAEEFKDKFDINRLRTGWEGRYTMDDPIMLHFEDGKASIINDGTAEYPKLLAFDGWGSYSLASLQANYPNLFGLETAEGLTVCVFSSYPDSYICGLLPGNVDKTTVSPTSVFNVTVNEMKTILEYYGLPDNRITVRPYYPTKGYYVADKEAYARTLSQLFDGRYKVGDEITLFGSAADRPLATLKALYPGIFELDVSQGLTVYYSPASGGRFAAGKIETLDRKEYNESSSAGLAAAEVERVLSWYKTEKGLQDKDILVRPFENMYSEYLDRSTIEKCVRELFGDRYEVGDFLKIKYE